MRCHGQGRGKMLDVQHGDDDVSQMCCSQGGGRLSMDLGGKERCVLQENNTPSHPNTSDTAPEDPAVGQTS